MTTLSLTRFQKPSLFNPLRSFGADWMAPSFFGDLIAEGDIPSVNLPRVDVREDEKSLSIVAEVPGLKKDEIQVTVNDGLLILSGESKKESEVKQDGYLRREISCGSFKRSFTLPDTLDLEKIEASYADGLLTVTFPKIEAALPKQIEVKIK